MAGIFKFRGVAGSHIDPRLLIGVVIVGCLLALAFGFADASAADLIGAALISGGSSSSENKTIYDTTTQNTNVQGAEVATVVSAAKGSTVNVTDAGAIRSAFDFLKDANRLSQESANKTISESLGVASRAGELAMSQVAAAVNPGRDTNQLMIVAASIVAAIVLMRG